MYIRNDDPSVIWWWDRPSGGGGWECRVRSVKIRRSREPLIERININDRVGMEIWKSKQERTAGGCRGGRCMDIPNLVRQYGPSCVSFFLAPKSFPRFLLLLIPTCSYNKIPRRVLGARVILQQLLLLILYICIIFFKSFYFLRTLYYNFTKSSKISCGPWNIASRRSYTHGKRPE